MTRKISHAMFRMLVDVRDHRHTVWATDRTAIALERRGLIERYDFCPSLRCDYCWLKVTELGRSALIVGTEAHTTYIGAN